MREGGAALPAGAPSPAAGHEGHDHGGAAPPAGPSGAPQ
jgi:hypothetical protein